MLNTDFLTPEAETSHLQLLQQHNDKNQLNFRR